MIDGNMVDPIDDLAINYLFYLGKETQFLDYKRFLDLSDAHHSLHLLKDIFSFANVGGGYLVFGIAENHPAESGIEGKFNPIGLPLHFKLDPSSLEEKLDSYSNVRIGIHYDEFYRTIEGDSRRFAILYVEPSLHIVKPKKDGEYRDENTSKSRRVFKKGLPYIRRGTKNAEASPMEIDYIDTRTKEERYQSSIISGEPDLIEETLYGNLFEVTKLPRRVYFGAPKFGSLAGALAELSKHMRPPINLTRMWDRRLVSLQNLEDPDNPYSALVKPGSAGHHDARQWLDDPNRRHVFVSLMNREILGYAGSRGLSSDYNGKERRLFFQTEHMERKKRFWPGKSRSARRTVAFQISLPPTGRPAMFHPAAKVSFKEINEKFFLVVDTTAVITSDGKRIISDKTTGPLITKLTYNKYNQSHLNDIFFWINELGEGKDIRIMDNFIVSSKPVEARTQFGIHWDIPPQDLESMAASHVPETEKDVMEAMKSANV
ncbi:MAG: ATP-binding protein [Hyphomicrobiaceae bacterium]|nr:ATP-binding protein [Hyphomicrobiaceae bacterium]